LPRRKLKRQGGSVIIVASIACLWASSGIAQVPGMSNSGRSRGSQRSEVDCSKSDDERCTRESGFDVGESGAGFGMRGKSVRRIKDPPSFGLNGDVALNYMYIKASAGDTDITFKGGGFLLGLRTFFGGPLPGAEGGSWSGGGIHVLGHLQVADGTVMDEKQTYGVIQLGGNLGYQYYHFGQLDTKSLRQNGVGVFAGWRLAYQLAGTSDPEWSFGHGPTFSLSFPTYNAGTARVFSWNINGLVFWLEDAYGISLGGGVSF